MNRILVRACGHGRGRSTIPDGAGDTAMNASLPIGMEIPRDRIIASRGGLTITARYWR